MQRSNDFAITTKRDGSRSFGGGDDGWAPRGRGSNRGHRPSNNYNQGGGYMRSSNRNRRGRGRGGHSYYGNSSNSVDPEGDVMMGGELDQGSSRRHNPYGQRPQSRHGRRNNNHYQRNGGERSNNRSNQGQDWGAARRLGLPVQSSSSTWSKVFVPMARKVDKQALLELIGTFTPGTFRPLQICYKGDSMMFYLDDNEVAKALRRKSKTVMMPNSSFKLMLSVKPSGPPNTPMNEENKGKLMTVMSARYDPSVKVLDLTFLHDDPALKQEGLFMPLNKPDVTGAVSNIIGENIPELVGLNLSKNRVMSLSPFQDMTSKAPNVISLNLANNQLNRIDELDKIKGWKLVELILDGNPLCDKFSSKSDYISAIRKRFPNVTRLDGNELPPPIRFDVGSSELPASKGSFFMNGEVQSLVLAFVKEFFGIYDSDNRQPLVNAYHENALFSMAMASNPTIENKQPFMSDYINDSRNHLRIRGAVYSISRQMDQLLKKGRDQVVACLATLPKTTHDPSSFVIDVNLMSSTLLSFVVTGLFKETDHKADKPPIRSFSRCFIAVPANSGVLITNDVLTVSNATPEQTQVAFKSTGPTPSSSPVSSNPPPLTTTTTPVPSTSSAVPPAAAGALSPQQQLEALPAERQQMVLAFSQQSNMNYIFSFRCLEDNAWDYDKAAQIFVGLQAEGKIPPEAFAK